MFWTWIKVDIRFCLIVPNIPTCYGHLQSGSDLVTKDWIGAAIKNWVFIQWTIIYFFQ
ncbi:hypothetical protein MtrunA17_Chr6g0457481 [Medicago truncatula]|uniref:Uncharacterized protein n=1 Tax=Medicago truncatula TaxID=3880 RepID=A0A396HB40_MEDTR|nr:hypothetical protein MtrunA17_Chr6g0457481 [Medicago truncatula]